MRHMIYHKRCGAYLVPMTAADEAFRRRHPRANRTPNGKLISDHGPGRAARRRQCHRVAEGIARDGADGVANRLREAIGVHALGSLGSAIRRGDTPLAALLHACKGACIGMQDYELAAIFLDMANKAAGEERE